MTPTVVIEPTDVAFITWGCESWRAIPPGEASDIAVTVAVPMPTLPPDCEDERFIESVLESSADQDVHILKIRDIREIERSENILSCNGEAHTSTGWDIYLVYSIGVDQDGNAFIEYRGDSYVPTPTPTR